MDNTLGPKIKNWKDLVEQFGFKPIGKNYKTAIEISRDLTFANRQLNLEENQGEPKVLKKGIVVFVGSEEKNTFTCVMVDCERENFDSAICTFELVGEEAGQRVYEYVGTAK